jgi:hypothetical protein
VSNLQWNLKYHSGVAGFLPNPLPTSRGFSNYLSKPVQHRNIELLPKQYAKSAKYLNFLDEVATVMDDALPVDTWQGQGYSSTGVENGFKDMRQVMGVAGTPYGTPPRDTETYRIRNLENSDKQIHQEFAKHPYLNREETDFMDRVFRLLVDHPPEPPKVPMKLIANTGLWNMDPGYQSSTAAQVVDTWLKRPERWIEYVRKGDTFKLASEGSPIAFTVGYRIQQNGVLPDGTPKPRESYDYHGNWVPINFEISPELTARGFYGVRPRVINMGTLGMFPLRLAARDIESHFKTSFEYCFLTRSPRHLGEKTAHATSLEMYDVKNHDWSAGEEQLQSLKKAFMLKYNDWVGNMYDMAFYAPDLVRNDYPDSKDELNAKWRGSLLNLDGYTDYAGNRSGIPVTSVVAKAWGVYYSLYGLWKRGDLQNTDEDIKRCLTGVHPMANVINAGDNIIIVNLAGQSDPIDNYVNIAVLEDTHTFLGWVPIKGAGSTTWLPNPESAVKKFLLADSSIGSNNRPFWADGVFRRTAYFSANPAAAEALRIMDVLSAKHFGWTITDIAKRYHTSPDIPVDRWSDADFQFAMNPEYIHYRLEVESVNPVMLERIYKLHTQEDTRYLSSLMRRAA